MDTNLGDALSGLLLLSSDSNNDSDDVSTTHITNDSDVTPTSNNNSLAQANSGSLDVSTTPPAAETKRRKYRKRGSTGFIRHKGSKKSKGTNKATRVAKQSANAVIKALLNNTFENEEDAFENNGSDNEDDAIENESVKLCKEDVRKLIHLFYIKIGCPPPEDWYGDGGTIAITIKALAMSDDKHRKVTRVITDTYHCLRQGDIYDKARASRNNVPTIADGTKIQQLISDYREAGLSFSQTTLLINMHCNKKIPRGG
jgi:hypothetical protein